MNSYGRQKTPFLFIINFDHTKSIVLPLQAAKKAHIFFDIQGITNYKYFKSEFSKPIIFTKTPISFEQYERAFQQVQSELRHGNSFLLNLTFPTQIDTNLSLKDIFQYSRAKYKLLFKNQFTVFSPESFVQIEENGSISSFPMKGTMDASIPNAAQIILHNPKEKSEHYTIVDLIRNDLNRVAKGINVARFRYMDEIKAHDGRHLLQISSKISGFLRPDWQKYIGDTIFTLLPAGSITGAPKEKTIEIIRAAEGYERGFYTGVMGIFDGKIVDSGVMIRFIEAENDQMTFKSGGGITVFSEVMSEYQELIQKVYVPINRNYPNRKRQNTVSEIPHCTVTPSEETIISAI
jgi:para-aminobenzoate synthetase component 1